MHSLGLRRRQERRGGEELVPEAAAQGLPEAQDASTDGAWTAAAMDSTRNVH